MDRRFITVLGVSLVGALIIASIFYQITARASGGKRAEGQMDTKEIVLAARPLTVGTMVKPTDVKVGHIVAAAFPKGGFSKVEEVVDRPVISNILLDEPVLEGRLAARGSGLGLAPIIPVGMRAVSVRVNDVAGVAGFVMPGMRVDVLVTGQPPAGDTTMTATCLQNLTVLSAGTVVQPDAKAQAKEVAELYGMPRKPIHPPAEAKPRPRPAPVAAAAPVPPPPPPPDQIVVIRGTQRSVETVGPARISQ